MKRQTKYLLGFLVWFGFGLFSMVLGWEHIITWVIGTYLYITFIEPFAKDEPKDKQNEGENNG